jgi:hypothetical protein
VFIVMSTLSLLQNAKKGTDLSHGGVFGVDATWSVNKEGYPLLTFGTVRLDAYLLILFMLLVHFVIFLPNMYNSWNYF